MQSSRGVGCDKDIVRTIESRKRNNERKIRERD